MGVKKKLQLTSLLGLSLFIMTACATNGTTSDITANSADFWSKFVYFFAEIIRFLSFDISIGVGIILFTVLIRTVLLPVFQVQWWLLEKCKKLNHALRRFENNIQVEIWKAKPS